LKVYDNHFNTNEWAILIGLLVSVFIVVVLPKRFSKKIAIVFFVCGIFTGFVFDHSISVQPVSFYDVNDNSSYQFFDFLSYLIFGPNSYLFFYIYDRFKPRSKAIYILLWSLVDVGLEYCAQLVGIYHYNYGYNIFYSFPIYLIVCSCWIGFYYGLRRLPMKCS
jgi:hypothetical protein